MDAAERYKEEKAGKVGVVSVSDTRVDPRTMVVHLHNTPEDGGGEEVKGKEHHQQIQRGRGIVYAGGMFVPEDILGVYRPTCILYI